MSSSSAASETAAPLEAITQVSSSSPDVKNADLTPVQSLSNEGEGDVTPKEGDSTSKQDRESTSPTSATAAERAFQHGLNRANLEQEVGQVMGTLGSWWGGVKKQSASALTNLKADIDKSLTQAQADLENLRSAKVEIVAKDEPSEAPQAQASTSTLFDRITASTSQLQQNLQTTLQTTLANNPNLTNPAQLTQQLAENLRISSARENLQLSMKQAEKLAEDYMRKGDQFVKDAEKWMGDAVKVIPPPDSSGVSWDGSDFYPIGNQMPTTNAPTIVFDSDIKTPRQSLSAGAVAGSRKEGLLVRLREDKDALQSAPEGEAFRMWLEEVWPKLKGKEQEEGSVGTLRMELVPEYMTDEVFWQRYLYQVHLIEAEDERRQQLLKASQDQGEDFSWDDEAEEANAASQSTSTLTPAQADVSTKTGNEASKPAPAVKVDTASKTQQSTTTSPRDSEESYDLVSDQGGKGVRAKPAPVGADDEDSDWE